MSYYIAEHRIYTAWLRERYSPPNPNTSIKAFERWDAIWQRIEREAAALSSTNRVERTRKRIITY